MINIKMIYKIMGFLLYIEAALLLVCAGIALIYNGNDLDDFLIVAGITAAVGGILSLLGKKAERKLSRRDGYVIVSMSWIVFTVFGMLPFYISGYVPSVANAFFETMSGFTTTGASILDDVESLPKGLLFWRSLTQWIGGLGIVFFTIAVLPIFGVGGVQLFAAEATGPKHDKVHPRIGVTAKWIWTVYLTLTVAETILLLFGGMDLFDSVCHSFSTTATGGYSTKQNSVAFFNSAYIEYVIATFMILSGINFTLLFFFMQGKLKRVAADSELKWYMWSLGICTAITTVGLVLSSPMGVEESFRKALFQVSSLHTTTGFVSADYMTWIPFLWALMAFIMFFGACGGSTTGGIKSIRLQMLSKITRNEFKHILHPSAVLPIRVNKQVVSSSIKSTVLAFVFFYICIVVVAWLTLMAMGIGFIEAFGTTVSSIGNVGPGLGLCGPAFSWNSLPDAAKWVLSFLMLIGRLELFTVLLMFSPDFWKKS